MHYKTPREHGTLVPRAPPRASTLYDTHVSGHFNSPLGRQTAETASAEATPSTVEMG